MSESGDEFLKKFLIGFQEFQNEGNDISKRALSVSSLPQVVNWEDLSDTIQAEVQQHTFWKSSNGNAAYFVLRNDQDLELAENRLKERFQNVVITRQRDRMETLVQHSHLDNTPATKATPLSTSSSILTPSSSSNVFPALSLANGVVTSEPSNEEAASEEFIKRNVLSNNFTSQVQRRKTKQALPRIPKTKAPPPPFYPCPICRSAIHKKPNFKQHLKDHDVADEGEILSMIEESQKMRGNFISASKWQESLQ